MKYTLSTVGEFYEVFNTETMTTVYVSDKRTTPYMPYSLTVGESRLVRPFMVLSLM